MRGDLLSALLRFPGKAPSQNQVVGGPGTGRHLGLAPRLVPPTAVLHPCGRIECGRLHLGSCFLALWGFGYDHLSLPLQRCRQRILHLGKGELYPRLAMAFVIAPPALMLLPAAIGLMRRRRLLSFEDFPQEEKAVVPAPPPAVTPPTHREVVPLTKKALTIAGILALLGLVLIIAFPAPHLGDFWDVRMGRREAQGIATKHLTERVLPSDASRGPQRLLLWGKPGFFAPGERLC